MTAIEVPATARERLTLSFATPRGALPLVFEFDRAQPVQGEMADILASGHFYEAETSLLLASILEPGDVFVDVGAHVGYFSVLAAAVVGPSGQVVSFEPSPRNYEGLVNHLRVNALRHVLPLHCAAGAEEGVMDLHLNADNDGGHALWDVGTHALNERTRRDPRRHPVFVTTIDRVMGVTGGGRVKAIKIDVEGNEHAVVRGARRVLEMHAVPFVIAEINRSGLQAMGTSEESLRDEMAALGYETWIVQGTPPVISRLERGQTVAGNYVFNVVFRRPGAEIG